MIALNLWVCYFPNPKKNHSKIDEKPPNSALTRSLKSPILGSRDTLIPRTLFEYSVALLFAFYE